MSFNTIGQNVLIESYRGEPKNVKGEIIDIRNLDEKPISQKQRLREKITRSCRLFTIKLETGEVKSYYDELLMFGAL